jgi:CheY-like chemotaxis protein
LHNNEGDLDLKIASKKAQVLVADDDALCRRALVMKLVKLDAEVAEAEDGSEAFSLRLQKFDLAIIDLEMPKMGGYDLLGCIRGVPQLKHLPVVVLTSSDDRRSLERALTGGATSFLIKPLNWTAFGAHIEHLLALSTQRFDRAV